MSNLFYDNRLVRVADTFMGVMLALDKFLRPVPCWCVFAENPDNFSQCRYCGHDNRAVRCMCACCNAARRRGWVMDPG